MNGCWGPMTEHIHTDKTVVDLVGKIRISKVRDRKQEAGKSLSSGTRGSAGGDLERQALQRRLVWGHCSMTSVLGREACYSGQVVKWDELVEKGPDFSQRS